jgi:hypothetical protein
MEHINVVAGNMCRQIFKNRVFLAVSHLAALRRMLTGPLGRVSFETTLIATPPTGQAGKAIAPAA